MRGRHSYAILKMLGMTETIAQSESEYIEIAVRLGLDPSWRHQIIQSMNDRRPNLFNDKACITALEAFYEWVVKSGE